MIAELRRELKTAILDSTLEELVALLRRYKDRGITQAEAYAMIESLRQEATDEATDDRILEVADFVAGFCSPHMKVWDG